MEITIYFLLLAIAVGFILRFYDEWHYPNFRADSEKNETILGKYLYKGLLFSLIFWGIYTIHDDLSKINDYLRQINQSIYYQKNNP
jgi:hypothetical protein